MSRQVYALLFMNLNQRAYSGKTVGEMGRVFARRWGRGSEAYLSHRLRAYKL